jgi:DNA-directed RNA polymerase subunit RPC12/RpoP
MGVTDRLVVSTQCPTCGAPLDFGEGSNAIRCDHCRSNLLVTGRGQCLSYSIAPRLERERAIATARFAEPADGGAFRTGDARLYFVPYYRFTASDLRWQRPQPHRDQERQKFRQSGESGTAGADFSSITIPLEQQPRPEFHDHFVEKNFVAGAVPSLGVYSLGVRPSVLRLALFRRAELEARGRIVAPVLGIDQALEHALRAPDLGRTLARVVVARVLSVVYFPFWLVAIERQGESRFTILDGVSSSIVRRGAPPSVVAELERPGAGEPRTAGFRPLVCPNCGWDFPVRPDDVVLRCTTCGRAWEIAGDELHATPHEIATVDDLPPATRLPVWSVAVRTPQGEPRRYFVPAFRYRRLKILNELAIRLSAAAVEYGTVPDDGVDLGGAPGAWLDHGEAALLARLVHLGLLNRDCRDADFFRVEEPAVEGAVLTWLPFASYGRELIAPFVGMALPKGLLF